MLTICTTRLGARNPKTLLSTARQRDWRISRRRLNTKSYATHLLRRNPPQRTLRLLCRIHGHRHGTVRKDRCRQCAGKNAIEPLRRSGRHLDNDTAVSAAITAGKANAFKGRNVEGRCEQSATCRDERSRGTKTAGIRGLQGRLRCWWRLWDGPDADGCQGHNGQLA